MRNLLQLCALLFAFGCAGSGTVQYSGSVSTPDLVEVSPGVQVVADYDEPVFFSEGFYWRYDNGGWYRSNNYASGFVFVDAPPVTVSRIERPERFVHYRPHGYVARNRPRERPEPVVRDHREPEFREHDQNRDERREDWRRDQPQQQQQQAPAPQPDVRDRHDMPAPTPPRSPEPQRVPDRQGEPRVPPQPPANDRRDERGRDKDRDKHDHRD
jgi:hypothetical protein